MNREDAIEALTSKGKTREQAEAFIDLMGSAFKRCGWIPGEPLDDNAIAERWETLFGPEEQKL